MIQGSPEWLAIRCGRVTASRVRDVVATTKSGGYGAGRKNYMAELIGERLTGTPAEQYVSAAMAEGSRREPAARFNYALKTGFEIEEVGFVNHPRIAMAGCSPDGLVGNDGLVEIKCPNLATHIDTLLSEKIDAGYMDQMQFQMACTGRAWVDFVSYDDRLPEEMQMSILRVMRDNKRIEKLELEVTQFLIDVDATVDLLRKRYMAEAMMITVSA